MFFLPPFKKKATVHRFKGSAQTRSSGGTFFCACLLTDQDFPFDPDLCLWHVMSGFGWKLLQQLSSFKKLK